MSLKSFNLFGRGNRLFFVAVATCGLLFVAGCAGAPLVPIDTSYPVKPASLPADLAAHEWAETEWWYYTGHLEDERGRSYGFELTFFRRRIDNDRPMGIPASWFGDTAMMAHFSLTNEERAEFIHDGGLWLCNKKIFAKKDRYEVAFKDWSARGDLARHDIKAQTDGASIDLSLFPLKPPVLYGEGGVVQKAEGRANYYISFTRMEASGTITVSGEKLAVSGMAWFDHEFGYMGNTAVTGWDWFSLQMDDNTEFMMYAIRMKDGTIAPESRAYRIDENGDIDSMPFSDVRVTVLSKWKSPHNGAVYPSSWRIETEQWGLDVIVIPTVADQEFRFHDVKYWEGSCVVMGSRANGKAYVELVGYAPWGEMARVLED